MDSLLNKSRPPVFCPGCSHDKIVHALDRAQRGDMETGLVFCGTNAWKANRIETVQEIFDEFFLSEVPQAVFG